MKCLNCDKELNNERAKYCSDKCRMAYSRRTKQPEQKQPEQTPEQERIGKVIEGYCHGCGKKVEWFICICLDCVQKGITHEKLGLDRNKCDPDYKAKKL